MKDEKKILKIVLSIGVILILASFIKPDIPGPADWLIEWTSWIATVVGTVVAARVFWAAPALIREFMEIKINRDNNQSAEDIPD